MKTYVIMLSKQFPATHPKAGAPTGFVENVAFKTHLELDKALGGYRNVQGSKLHTIRANYDLWEKRIEQVQKGEAILSLRYWTGKPYASKQEEFAKLKDKDGVGIQLLEFGKAYNSKTEKWDGEYDLNLATVDDACYVSPEALAKNDGLSLKDWRDWFKNYDLSKPMAIIHFTKYRY